MTDTIKVLERAGLLGNVRDADDGRAKRISLTPDGRVALAALLPGYFALIADFMARDTHDAS